MNKKIFSLIFCISLSLFAFNQNLTSYEAKKLELKKSIIIKGMKEKEVWSYEDEYRVKQVQNESESGFESLFILSQIGLSHLSDEYEIQLKNLEKYKSTVDFNKEKQQKENEERAKREDALRNTDYFLFTNEIKRKYDYWAAYKFTYEKTNEYRTRIIKETDSMLSKIIFEVMNPYITARNFKPDDVENSYDADKEMFKLNLSYRSLNWIDSIFVPAKTIQKFNINNIEYHLKHFYVDFNDLCFLNNELYQKKIHIFNDINSKSNISNLPFQCDKKLIFNFSELTDSIKFPELINKTYDYYEIKKRTVSPYVKYLDSLNYILKENIFNVNQTSIFNDLMFAETILDYRKKEDLLKRFNEISKELNTGESLSKKDYISIYFSKYPDKKTIADTSFYNYKCKFEKDTISYYKYFIEKQIYNEFYKDYASKRCLNDKLIEYSNIARGFNHEIFELANLYRNTQIIKKKVEIKFIDSEINELTENFYKKSDYELFRQISIYNLKSITSTEFYFKLDSKNEVYFLNRILSSIIDSFEKYNFYLVIELLNIVILDNKDLNKEYEKNKIYFNNQKDFLFAFLGKNYKEILNLNKESKKK